MKVGELIEAVIERVDESGLFLSADGISGFVNILELTWNPGKVDPRSFGKVGDLIAVKVYAVTDTGFYASLRDTDPGGDPYAQESAYSIGTQHDALIETVKPFGAFARLPTGALGLVRSAPLGLAPGDRLKVEVVSFDRALKKIELRPVNEG